MNPRCRYIPTVAVIAVLLAGCERSDSPLPIVGTLERDRLELIAQAQEELVEVMVTEGDEVEQGAVLLRLDESLLEAQLQEAGAARRRAEQRLAELSRGPRQERILAAQARLDGAADKLDTERREYERLERLLAEGVVTDSNLDRALAARQAAQAAHDEAEAALAELLDGTTREELAQARASVDETNAVVDRLEVIASRLTVRAPRAGIIDALPYKLGERPPVGATVVVMLADGAPYARVYIPEPIRSRVVSGLEARISVDGIEGAFAGTVRYVASEASFTPYRSLTQRDRSRFSYVAEIVLDDREARELPTGLPVEVDFPALK